MHFANATEIQGINEEIRKLRIMLARAKRRGTTGDRLAVSRELRAWLALQARTTSVIASEPENAKEPSRSEALSMAKAIVEAEMHSPDVSAWIQDLAERLKEQTNAD